MKLTILGSGTAAPLLDRNPAGYLVEAGNQKILLDSGAGTIRRLLEIKKSLFEIEHIFYTHLHNDHINELGAIIWSNNYGGKRKKPLNLYGPKGFRKYFDILLNKLLKPGKLNFKINVVELANSKVRIGNNTVKSYPTKHSSSTKSIAYRISDENKSLVYTGDTGYCMETIAAAKNADFLVTECSLPRKAKGHLTPSLAGMVAAKAGVKTLILTHFYPQVLKTDIRKECAKEFSGNVILARDKMEIYIK